MQSFFGTRLLLVTSLLLLAACGADRRSGAVRPNVDAPEIPAIVDTAAASPSPSDEPTTSASPDENDSGLGGLGLSGIGQGGGGSGAGQGYGSVGTPAPGASPEKIKYHRIPVFFATDRAPIAGQRAKERFGTGRADSVRYGQCVVSIPLGDRHQTGVLESPSAWKLEFRENPERHIVLLETAVMARDSFFAATAARIRASRDRAAFVFVHGYNVTFTDAARRTAQMAYDLGFDGAPVFYSWPSRAKFELYTVDAQTADWSKANLQAFLADFLERTPAAEVHVIAHSMGSRLLTNALTALAEQRPELTKKLGEIVLAAPDIDADVFKRDIAPRLMKTGKPVTLYASSRDRALAMSRRVNGESRAGYVRDGTPLVVIPGMETIDASEMETDFLGHSYYGGSPAVVTDIFYILKDGSRADRRARLNRVALGETQYWKFRP